MSPGDERFVERFLDLAAAIKEPLLLDPAFKDALARVPLIPGQAIGLRPGDAYDLLAGEAACALRLIAGLLWHGAEILEVGGGIGLAHMWLLRSGFRVLSLEPAQAGHEGAYQAGVALLRHLGLSPEGWLPMEAAAAPRLGRRFDLIFSNNVLEHMADLDGAMAALARCLKPGGVMRHNCPNYAFPYEPHFRIPLVPFWPRASALFARRLARDPLWRGINFVSGRRLRRIAADNGLALTFDPDHLYDTFRRLLTEPAFGRKHPVLMRLSSALESTGLLSALRLVPPTWVTPVKTTWRAPPAHPP